MDIRSPRFQGVDIIRECPVMAETDEGCTGREPLLIAAFVNSITDLVCPVDLLAYGRNALFGASAAPWVVLVDEATDFRPVWFHQLAADLNDAARDPEVACSVGSGGADIVDVAYRRDALELIGGFAGSDDWSMDLETQCRLVQAGFAVVAGERHVHDES